jgi:acetyl-CoA carboxylase carboxyl transferase subunit beta
MATSETEKSSEPLKPAREKRGVPGGLWLSCDDCGEMIFRKEAERLMSVCPECGYHMYLSARDRINWVLDEGTFEEWDGNLEPTDPL